MNNDNHTSLGDFLGNLGVGLFVIGAYVGFAYVVFWMAFLGHNCEKVHKCRCRDTWLEKWGEVSLLAFATGAFICIAAFIVEAIWGNGIFDPIPFYIGGTIAAITFITITMVLLYSIGRGIWYLLLSPFLLYQEINKRFFILHRK